MIRHLPLRGTKAKEKYHARAPIRHSRAGGNPGGREEEFLDSRLRGNDVLEQGKIQEFRGYHTYLRRLPSKKEAYGKIFKRTFLL